ncbi:MAG: adenylyltransferase/cytidyltransferase family protein [Geodermatophilaceae bacterium]
MHAGHIATLRHARRLGDCLVVRLNSDDSVRRLKGPDRPIVPAADRARVVAALGCVDAVVVFDEDTPAAVLDGLRPDVWVKGRRLRAARTCPRRRSCAAGAARPWPFRIWRGGPRPASSAP